MRSILLFLSLTRLGRASIYRGSPKCFRCCTFVDPETLPPLFPTPMHHLSPPSILASLLLLVALLQLLPPQAFQLLPSPVASQLLLPLVPFQLLLPLLVVHLLPMPDVQLLHRLHALHSLDGSRGWLSWRSLLVFEIFGRLQHPRLSRQNDLTRGLCYFGDCHGLCRRSLPWM